MLARPSGHNHAPPLGATGLGTADAPSAAVARPGEVLNLPNAITFARLCAVPLAVWLVLHRQFGWALAVFAAAGVSDGVDGFLARRRGGTALGAVLDPLADKALLVGMFVTLGLMGVLPDWIVLLVVFRDLVIVAGIAVLWAVGHRVRIRPLWVGKASTALQIVLVGMALLAAALPGLQSWSVEAGDAQPWRVPSWALDGLCWLVALAAVGSGAAYVGRAARAG